MLERIDPTRYRTLFDSQDEFAVIDVRLARRFKARHMLGATNIPLAVLADRLPTLVPLLETLIVLCDDNDGSALEASAVLEGLGYQNLALFDGGITAWQAAGGELFSGNSVLGKAFGEFVEHHCKTPSISAAELHRRQQQGEPCLLIDSRTVEEYESFRVPGAVLCPGAELGYRVSGAASTDDDIVVHCGGRTRSIVGAQTLVDFGFANAASLENGTMAWQFENLELESGEGTALPAPSAHALTNAKARARELADSFGIERLESLVEASTVTRYLIDVREQSEFEAGHIDGSRHVAGGHLLQNVDRYLLVRNAQIVLIDSDGVRATTVGVWLRRMGWPNVLTYHIDDAVDALITGGSELDSPKEDRELNPNDFPNRELLMSRNRAYLDWEIALLEQLVDEPAASQWRVAPTS